MLQITLLIFSESSKTSGKKGGKKNTEEDNDESEDDTDDDDDDDDIVIIEPGTFTEKCQGNLCIYFLTFRKNLSQLWINTFEYF